jgi:hypothetical protein
MSLSQQYLEIDGCRINLRRGGASAPLLYLHGASGAPMITPFMEKLAGSFEVLVPEHPGFGLSDEPEWLENIHDLAYFYLDFQPREGGPALPQDAPRDLPGAPLHRRGSAAGLGGPGLRSRD